MDGSVSNTDKDRSPHPHSLPGSDGCEGRSVDEVAGSGSRSNGGIDRISAPGPPEAGVARILVSANGVSSYHGRTSALFEDQAQDRLTAADDRPRMADDWVERGLVAEAAKQRMWLSSIIFFIALLDIMLKLSQ